MLLPCFLLYALKLQTFLKLFRSESDRLRFTSDLRASNSEVVMFSCSPSLSRRESAPFECLHTGRVCQSPQIAQSRAASTRKRLSRPVLRTEEDQRP